MASDRRGLIAHYERIAELGELELELVRTGRYDGLDALDAERQELIATLPASPPAEARPALLRAAAVQSQVEGLLSGAVAHTRAALIRLDRGKQALGAYAAAPSKPAHRVDTSG